MARHVSCALRTPTCNTAPHGSHSARDRRRVYIVPVYYVPFNGAIAISKGTFLIITTRRVCTCIYVPRVRTRAHYDIIIYYAVAFEFIFQTVMFKLYPTYGCLIFMRAYNTSTTRSKRIARPRAFQAPLLDRRAYGLRSNRSFRKPYFMRSSTMSVT